MSPFHVDGVNIAGDVDSVNMFVQDSEMSPNTPPAPSSPKQRRYHHGDLRASLIAAAQQLLGTSGSWTFTLREVARVAGVSHNAPYNHFADKRALLGAVAQVGFSQLGTALIRRVSAVAPESHQDRIVALALAYVRYAVENPAMFRLMFSDELADAGSLPELHADAASAFAILHETIVSAREAGAVERGGSDTYPLAAWALVHGLAILILDGRIPANEDSLDELICATANVLIHGMTLRP